MRIGFAITSLHGGGAEFVVRQWTRELSAEGHVIKLYTYKSPDDCSSLPLPDDVEHHHLSVQSRAGRIVCLPWWLRRRAKCDDIEVLVTMMTFANLAALVGLRSCWRSKVPVVISERNTMTVKQSLEGGNRVKRWSAQRLYRRASAIIAISHPVAADLAGACRIDMSRTFVIPNPVVHGVGSSGAMVVPDALHILFVGRLVTAKAPLLFVDTLARLAAHGAVVSGTVVGDGPLRSEFERYGNEKGVSLKFLGWREPWWDAVEEVDCLLLASAEEGFGNVLVEAAAAGIPCVARSSALGVADAIVPGVTGELSAGSRPEDLADAVLRAIRVDGRSAVERWLEHFSVSHSVDLLRGVLENVVSEVSGDS